VVVQNSTDINQPVVSLRERKKLKTRVAIQKHALKLFRKQGYVETTVEQIAATAEISPSTFFRYFPSKEDLVMYDPMDDVFIAVFRKQPSSLKVIPAFRATMREIFINMPADEIAEIEEKAKIMYGVPELHSRTMDEIMRSFELFTKVIAERVGRPDTDLEVQTTVGAILGVMMPIFLHMFDVQDDPQKAFKQMDDALGLLENGLKL
jgi:AcrR family transcriptional regulator